MPAFLRSFARPSPHKQSVATACSRSVEKAEKFIADHCPGAKAYGSYEDLLADAGIRAAYIPVPGLRTDVEMKAIAAKKHIDEEADGEHGRDGSA